MSNTIPVPYFSNVSAEKATFNQNQTSLTNKHGKIEHSKTSSKPIGVFGHKSKTFQSFLGLPSRKNPCIRTKTQNSRQQHQDKILSVFPQTQFSNESAQTYQPKRESILAQVETPNQIDRHFEEYNKTNFYSLAATDTVQNFAKFAQTKANQLNPLSRVASKKQRPSAKRQKIDIFDSFF